MADSSWEMQVLRGAGKFGCGTFEKISRPGAKRNAKDAKGYHVEF
jgi:hypothetical protein